MTSEERARFLRNILSDAERLSALVGRLRELARADNLAAGGETTLGEVLPGLRAAFPKLAMHGTGEALALPISAENLGIVLSHLADNAQRHGARRLALEASRDRRTLAIRIADDGNGIAPANRTRIFEAFFTTRREEGGTGMGLPIVQALVERHGGTISLEATGSGTTFLIRLPPAPALTI
jgi:signal transduction histidine kinase